MRPSIRSTLLTVLVAGTLLGCSSTTLPPRDDLSNFRVSLKKVVPTGSSSPLSVIPTCRARYGNDEALVPADVRGTRECPYAIPGGSIDAEVSIEAIGHDGNLLTDFNGPVSFRVVPGELARDYNFRQTQLTGGVGSGTVRASFVYSEVRIWVEDAPPAAIVDEGGTARRPDENIERSFATGLSPPIIFDEPTLAKMQYSSGNANNNRTSPFEGRYLVIGSQTANEAEQQLQTCSNDPANDGKPVKLVVTGIDAAGFYVTDATSCRIPEDSQEDQVAEPDGLYPGTFGHLYVYNYSYPEGLDRGDLLWSISGSVQEFNATTQLSFPTWVLREKDSELSERGMHLADIKPTELNMRLCGLSDQFTPNGADVLCGQSTRNLNYKLESAESGLVLLRGARFPEVSASCDRDGNSRLPYFEETTSTLPGCDAAQENCSVSTLIADGARGAPPTPEMIEEGACFYQCLTSTGAYEGKRCTDRLALAGFGQFVVELPGPGPKAANFDESLASRAAKVTLTAGSTKLPNKLSRGQDVNIWCDVPARYKWAAAAGAEDPELQPGTVVSHRLAAGEITVSFFRAEGGGNCFVAVNPRTKITLITRDTIPDLDIECSTDAAAVGETRARECRNLQGASFDVIGHLKHVGPATPSWIVIPRDAADICCYPGEGLECPTPIKPCK